MSCFPTEPAVVSGVKVDEISDRKAKIHWQRLLPTECCAFVVSYSVIYEARNDKVPQSKFSVSVIYTPVICTHGYCCNVDAPVFAQT